ncbi:putative membrane protein [Hymenobacter roseosalivarius DSM 11622]|uniref:Putative membrane protein n=2 Tax=Hymenobacter roseosalivarius TaxID=89967 RepID=A0A1W1VK30_9BACT|nr:putative membrane protein [Hymenobacter roseosalivarius DSM 11622]
MLLATSACSNEKTASTNTPTDSEEAGGNAGDNYMNAATGGTDSATATMPSDTMAGGSAAAAGTAPSGMNANSANPNGPTAPHKDDPEFMKSAAHSDQNEIQLSRLVLEKGVTGMAKDHANMMITDHTKSTADLKAIAQKKNVTLPTDMDPEHKALAAQMRQLSGPQLEQRFMQQMVTDHQKTLNTMQAHKAMTKDTELQGFITKTTPVIQKHLDMSKQHANMKM